MEKDNTKKPKLHASNRGVWLGGFNAGAEKELNLSRLQLEGIVNAGALGLNCCEFMIKEELERVYARLNAFELIRIDKGVRCEKPHKKSE